MKEHPKISKFTKFESYWLKHKDMVHFSKSPKLESLVWFGGTCSFRTWPIAVYVDHFSEGLIS